MDLDVNPELGSNSRRLSDEREEEGEGEEVDIDDIDDGEDDLKYSANKWVQVLFEEVVKEIAEIVEAEEGDKDGRQRLEIKKDEHVITREKSNVSDKQMETADKLLEMMVEKMPRLREKTFKNMDMFIIVPYFKGLGKKKKFSS